MLSEVFLCNATCLSVSLASGDAGAILMTEMWDTKLFWTAQRPPPLASTSRLTTTPAPGGRERGRGEVEPAVMTALIQSMEVGEEGDGEGKGKVEM